MSRAESGLPGSDWTLAMHSALCEAALETSRPILTVEQFLDSRAGQATVFRHDVDRFPANALQLARLEHRLGLQSTYYVRVSRSAPSRRFLEDLAAQGHEIGYHYEVLAKTSGDIGRALELFGEELEALRTVVPVRTAACHGSPLSRWDSLTLWSHAAPTDFDLAGEAYIDIDYSAVAYYTDTGRTWAQSAANLRDQVGAVPSFYRPVSSSRELMRVITDERVPALCIQTHPERWSATGPQYLRSLLLDLATNALKTVIRRVRPAHARG